MKNISSGAFSDKFDSPYIIDLHYFLCLPWPLIGWRRQNVKKHLCFLQTSFLELMMITALLVLCREPMVLHLFFDCGFCRATLSCLINRCNANTINSDPSLQVLSPEGFRGVKTMKIRLKSNFALFWTMKACKFGKNIFPKTQHNWRHRNVWKWPKMSHSFNFHDFFWHSQFFELFEFLKNEPFYQFSNKMFPDCSFSSSISAVTSCHGAPASSVRILDTQC